MKFAAFTDLHYGVIHDGDKRMREFIDSVKKEIDENMNVQIDGMEGHYQNVTPKDIGLGNTWNGVSIEPKTSSLYIELVQSASS